MHGSFLGPMHGKHVVCYVASWAVYRPAPGGFSLEDLEPSLCTHLVYSFAGLDEATMGIKSLDPWQDLEKDYAKAGYRRIVALKERYPHLKVTIAIGGWNEGSIKYSRMAETRENREKFIKSVLVFLDTYKFDGLDLDWEYPAIRDGRPIDKVNYVSLVKELKEAFEPHGYMLTAALGVGKATMEAAYDFARLSRYLDLMHMMCYDYHGTWDQVVGANAPLRGQSDSDPLSVEFTIKYMLAQGVSPYKLVLGLPMYGRNFILKDPNTKIIEFGRTPAEKVGFKGPLSGEAGFMGYNEICMELANTSSKWTQQWHEQSATPYLRDVERVVTYDNGRSIALKVKMAIDYGLGGLMVWSIDTDDFKGLCGPEKNAFLDFEDRYKQISVDPVLTEALQNLQLPDSNGLNKRSHYTTSNGKLHLRIPEQQYPNYNIMRTINDAATLAIEEKRIIDEMERVVKTNVIEDGEPSAASSVFSRAGMMFVCLLVMRGL
ncbi:probable chitinase 2 [Hyposmocoma kahamanoa]|uniref:probable chitinase 2 n=1 Tax=Hyposmocoma kahamanoa TaxID=1477025 RepID=UPI000E6D832F|nr:probable chitinase 2 [Hyposmocoma kahamanoa]